MPNTKKCTTCLLKLPLSEFYRDASGYLGLQATCKSCTKRRVNRYRTENPTRVRLGKAAHYQKHKSEINAKNSKWRKENLARARMTSRMWAKANSEKLAIYRKRWLSHNHDKRAKYVADYYANNREKIINLRAASVDDLKTIYVKERLRRLIPRGVPIPASLIEAKRRHLQLVRLLKEMRNVQKP